MCSVVALWYIAMTTTSTCSCQAALMSIRQHLAFVRHYYWSMIPRSHTSDYSVLQSVGCPSRFRIPSSGSQSEPYSKYLEWAQAVPTANHMGCELAAATSKSFFRPYHEAIAVTAAQSEREPCARLLLYYPCSDL